MPRLQISDDDLAAALAMWPGTTIDLAAALASRHGVRVRHDYLRQIACGQRRPRVKRQVDEIRREALRNLSRAAAARMSRVVLVLSEIMENSEAKPLDRIAAGDALWRIALAGRGENPRGEFVTDTDVMRELEEAGLVPPID